MDPEQVQMITSKEEARKTQVLLSQVGLECPTKFQAVLMIAKV
jgi:hypothetical protein